MLVIGLVLVYTLTFDMPIQNEKDDKSIRRLEHDNRFFIKTH